MKKSTYKKLAVNLLSKMNINKIRGMKVNQVKTMLANKMGLSNAGSSLVTSQPQLIKQVDGSLRPSLATMGASPRSLRPNIPVFADGAVGGGGGLNINLNVNTNLGPEMAQQIAREVTPVIEKIASTKMAGSVSGAIRSVSYATGRGGHTPY